MRKQLAKIWWSRLIISVRGYVTNYIVNDDEKLFLTDDAFIIIHQNLVESNVTNAIQQVCQNFFLFKLLKNSSIKAIFIAGKFRQLKARKRKF